MQTTAPSAASCRQCCWHLSEYHDLPHFPVLKKSRKGKCQKHIAICNLKFKLPSRDMRSVIELVMGHIYLCHALRSTAPFLGVPGAEYPCSVFGQHFMHSMWLISEFSSIGTSSICIIHTIRATWMLGLKYLHINNHHPWHPLQDSVQKNCGHPLHDDRASPWWWDTFSVLIMALPTWCQHKTKATKRQRQGRSSKEVVMDCWFCEDGDLNLGCDVDQFVQYWWQYSLFVIHQEQPLLSKWCFRRWRAEQN